MKINEIIKVSCEKPKVKKEVNIAVPQKAI